MAKIKQTDILIVGAGPVGLALAIVLKKFGLNFMIIEKDVSSTTQDRAISITTRTLEYLQLINVAERLVASGVPSYGAAFYYKSFKIAYTDFKPIPSQFNFILQISQPSIVRILNDELKNLGVNVQRPTEFISSEQHADGITCTVSDKGSNEDYTIETKFLIACDGSRSTIRTQSGFKFVGYVPNETTIVADMAMTNFPLPYETRKYILLPDNSVFFVVPMERMQGENVSRVIFTQSGQHEYNGEKQITDKLKSIIKELGFTKTEYSEPKWTTNFNPKQFVIEKYFDNNVIYLGDAAHIQSPIGAQGLNTGVQDVFNLAWKLLFVKKYNFKPALLETYHTERHPIAEKLLKYNESVATKTYKTNLFKRVFRLVLKKLNILPYFRNAEIGVMSQISLFYPKKTKRVNKRLIEGHRMPNMPLSAIDSSLYELTQLDKFLFVIFDNGETIRSLNEYIKHYQPYAHTIVISKKHHENSNNGNIHYIHDKNNTLHHQYHIKDKLLCLVRPDNYIGLVLTKRITDNDIDNYFYKTIYQ